MSKYQEWVQTAQDRMQKVADLFDSMNGEIPTAEQTDELKKLYADANEAQAKCADLKGVEQMRIDTEKNIASNKEIIRTFGGDTSREKVDKQSVSFDEQKRQVHSPANEFLGNDDVKDWLSKIAPTGQVSRAQFGMSPAVDVKTLITGASSTSAGAFVITDRKPIVDPGTFYREITLLDIITIGETSSDTVDYVREGAHTNNAAPVAEATASGDGSGVKPESEFLLSVVSEAVKIIAHWIPVSRNSLADAGQIRTYIDQFLRYGLEEELEDQMLTGSGAGQNFTGVLNLSGRTAQAFDTDILTTTRKAITKVKVTGKTRPTAFVMHPNDWEDFDLLQDNQARYFFGGPTQLGVPRLWGLPVVESLGMTEGRSVCANWKMAVLWNRMRTMIMMSDSHADFFIRNLIAVLAEMRAAFTFLRPAAFVDIDLTA